MKRYYMGIDNGGTSTKAVLFDASGREVASAKRNTPVSALRPGFTERDMEALWQANCEAVAETIEKSGVDPALIAGVSFSGHGKGLYLWGENGPARPGIVSTDSRAYACAEQWNTDGTAERLFPKTCQSLLACQPSALLKWILENEPGVVEKAKYVFGVKDYVRFRMTGEAYSEITDMSGSGLVNLHTAAYDDEILRALGLECVKDKLAPLVYSSEFCGKVTKDCAEKTGLKEGTPVAAGLFDIDACAIAMNIVNDTRIAAIAGTWSINEYVAKAPVMDRSVKMNSLYCLPGYYLAEECSPTSASNQEWFVQNFLRELSEDQGEKLYETANRLAASVKPDGQSIVFLPYLYSGIDDPRAMSAFIGLDASHTRADMMRAVYEGVVFGHKKHVERLLGSRKTPPEAVRLAGGAVHSPLWVQMFADILELPVETVEADELGALGAAMTAAVAAGDYENLTQAAKAMVRMGKVYRPDSTYRDAYRAKYEKFLLADGALAPVWSKLSAR